MNDKGKPTAEGGSSEDSTGSDLHKTYAVADLPEAGEKIPPADQGRIVITLPLGWKTLPRNPKFLVAMIPEENAANSLPRIAVSVTDAPAGLAASTTAENAAEQAKTLQAAADKEVKEKDKKPYVETCKPLGIGDHTWIRHVRQAKLTGAPVAIQSLQMVKDGRLYSVELTVPAKENTTSSKPPILYAKALQEHRKFAYSVAAHIKFPKEGNAPPATTDFAPPAEGDQPKPEPGKPEPEKSE